MNQANELREQIGLTGRELIEMLNDGGAHGRSSPRKSGSSGALLPRRLGHCAFGGTDPSVLRVNRSVCATKGAWPLGSGQHRLRAG